MGEEIGKGKDSGGRNWEYWKVGAKIKKEKERRESEFGEEEGELGLDRTVP